MANFSFRLASMATTLLRRPQQRIRSMLHTTNQSWNRHSRMVSHVWSPLVWLRVRLTSTDDKEANTSPSGLRRQPEPSRHSWRVCLLGLLAMVTLIELMSLTSPGGGKNQDRHRKRSFASNFFERGRGRRSRSGPSHGLAGSLSPDGLTSHYQMSYQETATNQAALPLTASGLTADDRKLLAGVLGFGNFSSFVAVDTAGVQKLAAAAAAYQAASTPCLWSQSLQRNVYLIPGGWDQTSGRSSQPNDKHACPLPAGGQLPPVSQSESPVYASNALAMNFDDIDDEGDGDDDSSIGSSQRPVVTFVVAIHLRDGVPPRLASAVALEAAIALFRHANEVPPSEYIFVDHTSNQGTVSSASSQSLPEGLNPDGSLDLSELQEFLAFLQQAFGLRIRFLRASETSKFSSDSSSRNSVSSITNSGNKESTYLDLTTAALGSAQGKLVMMLEADNILQPGCLASLAATFVAHPEAALVVPKMLRHGDGRVHNAGGVVLSDGSLRQFGQGMEASDESVSHLRDVDYGSWVACLAKRRLLVGLGLPDARFRPGYYADVDASFALRRAGWRTVYQPFAHVLHYDGASGAPLAGIDPSLTPRSSGGGDALRVPLRGQRFAALNQQKLATKWAAPLSCHLSPDLLADAHTRQHRPTASTVPVAAASGNFNDAAVAHNDRYVRAGSVAKALNLRHGSPGANKGGGGRLQATSSVTDVASARDLTDGLGWTLEAVAGAARTASLRVLFVDWIAPEVDRDSGSIRARYMLQILLAARCAVTFVAIDTARPMHYRDDLRFMGIKVLTLRQLRASLLGRPLPAPGSLVSEAEDAPMPTKPGVLPPCPFDVLVLSRRDAFRSAFPILQERCQSAAIVFDTVDLHFLRESREAAYKETYKRQSSTASSDSLVAGSHQSEGDGGGMLNAVFSSSGSSSGNSKGTNLKERLLTHSKAARSQAQDVELQFASFADVTLVVSSFEATEVAARVPKANIEVVSNIHVLDPTPASFRQRNGVVFTGNFNHLPNRDAVLFFAQDILPLVLPQVGPDFVFHVVGANKVPDTIQRLNGTMVDGIVRIVVHGFVPDLKAFYNNMRVSVVPLRWGAGVKGKVNSAMSHGVPVVCTSIAQEGMHLIDGSDAFVTDDPREFAAKVLEAYTSERAWRKLRKGGFANIQQYFSISNAVAGLCAMLKATLRQSTAAANNDRNTVATAAAQDTAPTATLQVLGSSSAATATLATPANQGGTAAVAPTSHQAARTEHLTYGACAVDASCTCSADLRDRFAWSAFGLGTADGIVNSAAAR